MSKTKVRLSASQVSDKWAGRIKAAIPDIVSGVEGVTDSPMEKAIAKKDKMRANVLSAIDDGSWENGLKKVSLADWKTKTAAKVRERLSGGVDAGMDKRKQFDTWLVDRLNGVLPDIAAMPDMTLEDSVNRVRRLMEHMASEKYKAV